MNDERELKPTVPGEVQKVKKIVSNFIVQKFGSFIIYTYTLILLTNLIL